MPFLRKQQYKASNLPPEIELSETSDGCSSYYSSSSAEGLRGLFEDYESRSRRRRQGHTRSITPYRIDISSGVTISYDHINCYAPEIKKGLCGRTYKSGRYKQLLFDVSGVVQPGMLVAVMGASGAGKSTLLNILTCRNLGSLRVQGSVKANGVDMGPNIKNVSAYVQQDDLFWGRLRVREQLWFNAVLRMGCGFTAKEQRLRVEELLKDMGLERCADSYINHSGGKGLSGSERKLLSIACEILTDPPLLFCDEPTTGLDAMMAGKVVSMLQRLSSRGKTVLCTIHQPASHIFDRFDQVLLLAEGRLAFMGSKERTSDFFSDIGFPCPMNYNPADHYIHTLAIRPGEEAECRANVIYVARKFKDTLEYTTVQKQILAIDKMEGDPEFESVLRETARASRYKSTWCQQIRMNVWKQYLDILRDPKVYGIRILQNLIATVLCSLIYFQQPYNTYGAMNINGAVFQIILVMTTLAIAQLTFVVCELDVFFREHHNGMYRTDTFFIAKNIAEIPLCLVEVGSTVIVSYWLIGMYPQFVNFLIYSLIIFLVFQFSLSLNVYLISIVCGRIDIALNIAPPIRIICMLMGGYIINDESLPNYISWLKWLSWHHYSFELLMINQWKDVESLDCDGSGALCFPTGQDMIRFLNFSESNVPFNFAMLIALTLLYRLIGFFALWIRARERKREQ